MKRIKIMKSWYYLFSFLLFLIACDKALVPQERETTCVNGVAERLENRNGRWYRYNEQDSLISVKVEYARTYLTIVMGCPYAIDRDGKYVIQKNYERDKTTGDTLSYVYCDGKGKEFRWYAYMPVGVELVFYRYTRSGKHYDVSSRWDTKLQDTVMKTVITYGSRDVQYEETLEGGNKQFYEVHYSPIDTTFITSKYFYADGIHLNWYFEAADSLSSVQYFCK